jgi:ADP-L-glycero-D-manno-heptose 6-epimerase
MNRLILVTGGAGFIGSNIVAALVGRGYDVAVSDRLRGAESGKWRNLAKHAIADFIDPDHLPAWLAGRGGGVDAIIHMGAVSSTTEPDADRIIHSNFTLSRDLFEWCAENERALIYASSAATYGDGALGFADDDSLDALKALRPLNAYGWSKALFDIYARRSADRGVAPPQWAGLKFFNVYGPNEGHKGGMKSVVAQIWPTVADGGTVRLFQSHNPAYADGGQLRDFVYVRDAVNGVLWLLDNPRVSGVFNMGSGQARSFRDLALATFAAAGRTPDIAFIPTPEVIRDRYQYFTQGPIDRLRAAGYAGASTPLEEGVAEYVQTYLSKADPHR